MRIAGVIIAGGKSSRMGGREKALLPLAGRPLLAHVINRLAPQVNELAINANGDPQRFAAFNLPVIADRLTEVGTPLAGVKAALAWAIERNADHVLTVPSDCPLLPADLAERLSSQPPAIAESGGQPHYLTGLWPVALHARLHRAMLEEGLRAVRQFAAAVGARHVGWPTQPADPFLNINTPQDLAEVAAILDSPHA